MFHMQTLPPSHSLSNINAKHTKMVKIEGKNMYKNPLIDVVLDTNGNFYSNKMNNGYRLLTGNKVHYVLNLDGKIIKGNTSQKSLAKILLGGNTALEKNKMVSSTVEQKKSKVGVKTKPSIKVAKPSTLVQPTKVSANNAKIIKLIGEIEESLAVLKSLAA